MNIENYIKKKKLLGMRECNIVKVDKLCNTKEEMFLNRSYVQDNEVLFIVNIKHDNIDKGIITRYVGDRKFIDSCTGYLYQHRDYKLGIKVLNTLAITQFTEDFDLEQSDKKIVIAEFNNGNVIALRYNSRYSFEIIKTGKFGYCISIRKKEQNYSDFVMIDDELNRYFCRVERQFYEYIPDEKLGEDEFEFNSINFSRLRLGKIVEKLDKLDKDYVEDAEIYEV